MNVRYKSFANRSARDIQFDQLLMTKPLTTRSSTTTATFSETRTTPPSRLTSLSPRKRVNVVSFTPGGDSQEVITRSSVIASSLPDTHGSTLTPACNPLFVTSKVTTPGAAPLIPGSIKSAVARPSTVLTTTRSNSKSAVSSVASGALAVPSRSGPGKRVSAVNITPSSVENLSGKSAASLQTGTSYTLRKIPTVNIGAKMTTDLTTTTSGTQISFAGMRNTSVASHSAVPSVHSSAIDENNLKDSGTDGSLGNKKRRVAYNPRSWQRDIDPEETSPVKQPRMPVVRSDSQTPSLSGRILTKTLTNEKSGKAQPKSGVTDTLKANCKKPSPASTFGFPDSDEDTLSDDNHKPMNRARLPRRNSSAADMPTQTSATRTPSPVRSDNNSEEDNEMDDVKPWFAPPERNTLPQKEKATSKAEKSVPNRVDRTQKPLYTIVHKVNEARICQERGETQHLLDDVKYLIDGLADHNQINTRSLSVLTLANKCLTPSFRYMINEHGLVRRICANLHDAYKDYTLALTTAGLFFILSRDRDPNVFDMDSLPVMIKLLQSPDSLTLTDGSTTAGPQALARANKEAERVRMRVRQLLDGLQQRNRNKAKQQQQSNKSGGENKLSISSPTCLLTGAAALNTRHLQMTRQLTASDLVLEGILNLGTRKAAEWFKRELCRSGGLDRVADAATDAVDYLGDLADTASNPPSTRSVWRSYANPTGLDRFALDKLRRVGHYTKLLENMTYMNSDNQTYLVRYRDRLLINRLVRCVRLCAHHLPSNQQTTAPGDDLAVLVDCILGVLRFLVNVSHNEFVSDRLGGCPDLLETVLECILHLPDRLPQNKRFDLLVLTLCLLVNMCEHCPENRTRVVHLDVRKSWNGSPAGLGQTGENDDGSDEENLNRRPETISALDELIKLFSVREALARNHDFERDDEAAEEAEERRRREQTEATANHLDPLGRPTHVEEAGLKWRLIEDRKATGMFSDRGRSTGLLGRKLRGKRKRRKPTRFRKRSDGSDDDDDEEEDSGEEDEDAADSDEEPSDEEEDDNEDDDDESVGSGADVEFVADTQEEQEKLAERMSQAQQHMEDSVVAAYVALLLGCILQSSRLYAEKIRAKLPDGQFRPLAIMLAKLLSFLSLTKGVGSSGSETILRIVRILEAQDTNNTSNSLPTTDTKPFI